MKTTKIDHSYTVVTIVQNNSNHSPVAQAEWCRLEGEQMKFGKTYIDQRAY